MKYTPEEVSEHCFPDDCWVTIFEKVLDVTKLIQQNRGELTLPILKFAGKSISHWFDYKTKDVRTYIEKKTNVRLPYTPDGRFLHLLVPAPLNNVEMVEVPWWKDEKYVIGELTEKKRYILLLNTVTHEEDKLLVCQEDSLTRIMEKYLEYNKHAESYTWKALVDDKIINLNMNQTLAENGIKDESTEFESLDLQGDVHIPTILLYYNDDLTYA